jgi:hypothetical protein
MRRLLRAIKSLALWQQITIGAIVLLILLTWFAVFLVITGYLGP